MATHDYVIANGTGAAVRSDLNNALAAIVSNNSSSSEPGTTYAYQWWADTNANVLKIRNSANDAWITLRELDGTMLIEDGSASTPGLAFADDVNTGIFSGGADEIALATAGAERLKISTSEAVFNDVSNDIDFRVESNGQTHMLYVDAGNDRIGIKESSPSTDVEFSRSGNNPHGLSLTCTDSTNSPRLFFESTSTSNAPVLFSNDGNLVFHIGGTPGSSSGTEQVRLDTSGRLLVGATSAIFDNTNAKVQIAADAGGTLAIGRSDTSVTTGNGIGLIRFYGNDDSGYQECARIAANADGTHANDDKPTRLEFLTTADGGSSPTEQLRINSAGDVLFKQEASSSPYPQQKLKWSNDGTTANGFYISQNDDRNGVIFHEQGLDILFGTNNTERMRLNSSGNLLLGHTSAADSSNRLELENSSGGRMGFLRDDTSVIENDDIGILSFYGNDSSGTYHTIGQIGVHAAGTHSTGSKPTRMIFSTCESSANNITEAMRITSGKSLLIGQTNESFGTKGVIMKHSGQTFVICAGDTPLLINRQDDDGELIRLAQNDATEGNITVSGSTVSYNGAHLSRWSQLAGGAERTEILRGSVLSNLDEMCEWAYEAQDAVLYTDEDELPEGVSVGDVKTPARAAGTEDNEQLNRMKVSDVEGDANVAGVFQAWDDDDDTYTNDFYCAMTGDFVIRIAQGTTVARGDLLMSAGDGTAKPQDDDIVRSKTIAKVTSTTVSTTYSDGSYCVPCVLMAC